MPSYKVLEKGFYGGVLRVPGGPHDPVVTSSPIAKAAMPSWLEEIKAPTSRKKAAEKVTVANSSAEDFIGDESGIETL